ncbi:MAG: hypothetical protein ACOYN3_10000 [Acidimicrobiia bacterium]
MGSGGRKKGSHHLPKVGTPQNQHFEHHHEREAVLENFGIDPQHVNPIIKWIVVAVIVVLAASAALSLALFT